jgi:hypothetical protein
MVRRRTRRGPLAEAHDGVAPGVTGAKVSGWLRDNDPDRRTFAVPDPVEIEDDELDAWLSA